MDVCVVWCNLVVDHPRRVWGPYLFVPPLLSPLPSSSPVRVQGGGGYK